MSGHILVAGSGASNPVAARFAHLLSCVGTPALFIHLGDSQHGLAGAVTEKRESTLGEMAGFVLKVVAPPDVDPFGMVATGSTLVYSVFADAMCVALLNMRDYAIAELGQIHPGGAVDRGPHGEDQ